jgi:shikimate kinase
MGVGKSTLGKALAERMKLSLIDTDIFIENRYHRRISDIFAAHGEERFRDIEHRAICEVSQCEDVVVSTGGGLPCFNNNMDVMNDAGITVYLKTSVTQLAARLQASKTVRPVLKNRTGSELEAFIADSLAKRKQFYEQARIIFDAEVMFDDRDVSTMAALLEELIIKQK